MKVFVLVPVDRMTSDNLNNGTCALEAEIKVSYAAPGGARYSHTARFVLTETFKISGSSALRQTGRGEAYVATEYFAAK